MGIVNYIDKKYSSVRRYNQIIRVLLKYGFENLVVYMHEGNHFNFLKKLIPKSTYEHALYLSKWEKIRLVCEELGPTFVKFGQLVSNRPDLVPAELIKELEKLQDGVPPIAGNLAIKVVEKELGKKTEELFSFFEQEAFASASIAQVHRATLRNGEKVVLKIQRPGIKEVIEADIKVMLYMAEIFGKRIPSLKSFDPIGLVRNFEDSIIKELDFIHESVNIQRFHNNFFKDKSEEGWIHSPKTYAEFTTSKILTMEYIDGVKISDINKLSSNGYLPGVIGERMALSYFKQVFNYGFFHADPHPGNLLVLPGNVICYLDYGMMGSISKKDLEALGYLFLAIKSKDVIKIIRSLQQLSDNIVIINQRELESDLSEMVENYAFRSLHQNEISTMLLQLKDIIVKHGLQAPAHFFLLIRSMVTAEGVIRQLNPGLDLEQMLKPYLLKIVARHYNPLQFVKKIFNSVYEMGMYMEDLPRDLKNAIRKINTGEIKVDLRHKGIDPLVHTLNRITRQIISAVIIAALILGSSLMIVHNIHPLWGSTSSIGIIGFIISGFIFLGMIKDLRKGDHDNWPGWND